MPNNQRFDLAREAAEPRPQTRQIKAPSDSSDDPGNSSGERIPESWNNISFNFEWPKREERIGE